MHLRRSPVGQSTTERGRRLMAARLSDRDLTALAALVGRSRAWRERGAIFHLGGLQWWLRRVGRAAFDVAVLSDHEEIVGLALRDESDVIVQTDAAHAKDRAELLAWVEARAGESMEPELFLRSSVMSRGYEPSERYGYELVYDTAVEPPSLSFRRASR